MLTLRRLFRLTRLDREEGQVLPNLRRRDTCHVAHDRSGGRRREPVSEQAVAPERRGCFGGRSSAVHRRPHQLPRCSRSWYMRRDICGSQRVIGRKRESHDSARPAAPPSPLRRLRRTRRVVTSIRTPTTGRSRSGLPGRPRTSSARLLGVAFKTSTQSARAVGTVFGGPPPPLTFAALDPLCDNHTLLIKLGGVLTVNQIDLRRTLQRPAGCVRRLPAAAVRCPEHPRPWRVGTPTAARFRRQDRSDVAAGHAMSDVTHRPTTTTAPRCSRPRRQTGAPSMA